jgi:tetratricopeptide (TPR) repeat protein
MATLTFLAEQLGKPVSFFLDEEVVISPNVERMTEARTCFGAGDYAGALEQLLSYESPDETFAWEKDLLLARCYMALAVRALEEKRLPYAAELLQKAAEAGNMTPYYGPELDRERKLLLAQTEADVTLPADDRALLFRAKKALAEDNAVRAASYLDAAEEQNTPDWNYFRGECYFVCGEHEQAASCYRAAEEAYPRETARRLEVCYRTLEDYKMAYFYACKQRD